ncbi:hypothetical protein E6C27_scaffold773G00160 [Cucumis melo var. makuwa]|uniref:Uncharacterized protein n=1 Tax=Cucumis melo var. makuwa TaxID=1194695 RepID=A0A5A7UAS7_CUCMM|nr:hypothetical protein E6C27_scaffold773G00160 [Cucumis melo var. makuwa]
MIGIGIRAQKGKKKRKEEETLNFPSPPVAAVTDERRGVSSRRIGPCAIPCSQLRAEATPYELLSSSSAPFRHPPPQSVVDGWSSPPPGQRRVIGRPSAQSVACTKNPSCTHASSRSASQTNPTRDLLHEPTRTHSRAYTTVEPHARPCLHCSRAACMPALALTYLLGKRDFAVRTRLGKSPIRRDRQSGIDIDMIRVIRQDRSQPDCLSVSSGYTTDQFVLGVPLGSPKTSYVPPGSHVPRVRERASSWVPLSGL